MGLFDGLVAYYDFRNWDLSNLVTGEKATNNGATLTTDHLGYENCAYHFSWVDWIYMNLNTYITWNTYTVWWWYKINSADTYWVLLTQWTTTNKTNKFTIEVDSDWEITFVVPNTSGTGYWVSDAPPDWKWHFFIGTFDWTNVKFYKDWVLLGTTTFSWTPVDNTDSITISAYSNSTTYNIKWDVSCIFLFDRVLAYNEIKLLYDLTKQ